MMGRVHTRVMLTPGYLPDLCSDEMVQIRRGLTYLMEPQNASIPGQQTMFDTDPRLNYSEKVCGYIDKFWTQIKDSGKIDSARTSYDEAERKARKLIDVNTIQHTDAREIGAENVCLQAIRELQIDTFLRHEGWSERKIQATLASLIIRTVYSPSEWAALRILDENSAAMELLTGQFGDCPTQREVYAAAPSLYALKEKLEHHLCSRTDSLFNLTNRLMLFDLTISILRVANQVQRRQNSAVRRKNVQIVAFSCLPWQSIPKALSDTVQSLQATRQIQIRYQRW